MSPIPKEGDCEYLVRRKRNNESVKKTRMKKRAAELDRKRLLETKNISLKSKGMRQGLILESSGLNGKN
jgi:hypothetical protein